MSILVKVKPLSVNRCWQGRRFKTKVYKDYEKELLSELPQLYLKPSGKLELRIEVGVSSKLADLDNISKPFIDILQKRYNFNDNRIYSLKLLKKDVEKGKEYIQFQFYETPITH